MFKNDLKLKRYYPMLIVRPLIQLISVFYLISINLAYADGPVGEHVNDLQSHLSEYSDEVLWLIDQVESIVNRYEQGGVELAQPEMVVDHWEEVWKYPKVLGM